MRSWSQFVFVSMAVFLPARHLSAQELKVRSEFQRIGADGNVIAQDQQERAREILSPAMARNGFASFFLTAIIPAGREYSLEIGQNPENAVRVVAYRQHYNPNGIPDRLEQVPFPVSGKTTAEEHLTFWVDFWVDADRKSTRLNSSH